MLLHSYQIGPELKKTSLHEMDKEVQILSSERESCLSLMTKLDIKGQTHMISQKIDKWLYIILLYMNNCSIYQKWLFPSLFTLNKITDIR